MTQVCVTSVNSVGCTFLDWSIHFLSGCNEFYNTKAQSYIPLTLNPVTSTNAHGHLKNHPSGVDQFEQYVNMFDQLSNKQLHSVYPVPLHIDKAATQLGIDHTQIHKNYSILNQYVQDDYNRLLQMCYQRGIKIVFVASDPRVPFYLMNQRTLDRWFAKPGKPNSTADASKEIQEIFFNNSISTWTSLGLVNVWDERERRALDLRISTDTLEVKFEFPHLWINALDLWTRGDSIIHKVMEYLELPIDATRLAQWIPIFKSWQKIQVNNLAFDYNCEHIVNAIVNNWYYQIDLTFDQEVVIQHLLIYKHNLNLKTWELSKFPDNTQDLHKLLETNIHQVDEIYR